MNLLKLTCVFSIGCLGALFSLSATGSPLVWEQSEISVEMEPDASTVQSVFKATNKGNSDIRIASVKTSCGCTGSVLDRSVLRPGESTKIVATFNKGNRQGRNNNRLEVFLEGQAKPEATLSMIVTIPKLVDAQPQIIFWNRNSSRTERTSRINLDERYVDSISEIRYNADLLTVHTAPDPENKAALLLSVMPKSFDQGLRETIQIEAKRKDGRKADLRVHVFVQM